jgi:prolipoprotein diacylglyceryl transferase
VWYLGPFPLRAYALAIILGILAAIVITDRRWVARGGSPGVAADVAVWAVPFGIVGGRIYHVITSPAPYFGPGGDPVDAVKVWQGGLGIWGAVVVGGVGAWIACRRRGIPLPPFGDALAPGLAVAQAIGRFGNYANQELFGRPTDLPWGLQIDPRHRPAVYAEADTFHPTFLYESLWCLGVAALVWWVDRRLRLGHGRAFALYVAAYCVGRFWIEGMRVDAAQQVLGLRLNEWTSVVVFLGALAYLLVSARVRPGREHVVEPRRESRGTAATGEPGHTAAGGQAAALGGPHDETTGKEAP